VGVASQSEADCALAQQLARRLSLDLVDGAVAGKHLDPGQALLTVTDGMPALQMTGRNAPGPVTVDFADAAMANRRRSGHNELLGKAVGWKQRSAPSVLDATGGFCRDAFLLADLGCRVLVCERNPVMATLIDCALKRAAASPDPWLRDVCARITLRGQDAVTLEPASFTQTDVIYIDPMFPLDRRAAPAKEMQVLHRLLGTEESSSGEQSSAGCQYPAKGPEGDAALLAWARAQTVQRVVVKRPRRAAAIAGAIPGHSVSGRSVRFDVYPLSGSARANSQSTARQP
jgi:16S rRNA (guanine1516-N2)-methyltransferase